MLTQVGITQYRGFPNFAVRGLSRVNLLVGKNNSGKTALLEAIQFLASGGDPAVLVEVAHRRGELIQRRSDGPALVDIGHLFHGHGLRVGGEFSLAGNNGYAPVTVKVVTVSGRNRKISAEKSPRRPQFAIRIEGGRRKTKDPRLYRISHEGGVMFDDPAPWRFEDEEQALFGRAPISPGATSRFIGTELVDSMSLAEMLDGVAVLGNEQMLADALRLLDSKLQYVRQLSGLTAVGFRGSRAGVIAKMDTPETPIPLGSLGEGMRRMLTLAAALVTTSGGYLFIDEVDTGFHFSVMHKMWELILTTAAVYDIQVFATSHSYDCIWGLSRILASNPDLGEYVSIHRVESEKQESTLFEADELLTAIRQDIEIR